MTVALDATYSLGEDLSGVGIYSRELLLGLAADHPETRFHFCYRPHRYLRSWAEDLPPNARRRWLGPGFLSHADLFHGLNQRLPPGRLPRMVTTFHDLFVLTGDYSTHEFRTRFATQARDAAARAEILIAVSEFTRSQIVNLLGVEAGRVHVVHHGIRPLALLPVAREPIILHVGAIQKRKNIERLVEAFETVDSGWKLVLAGASGFGAAEILARIERSPARGRIQVTGYVSAGDLARWYSRASIFAFPSLDEGFGMPVVEAMAAGIPVITSNRSSLPEVAGDAAILIDPERTESLCEALRQLVGDEECRRQWSVRGHQRAQGFSWEKAVQETWQVYQQLLG